MKGPSFYFQKNYAILYIVGEYMNTGRIEINGKLVEFNLGIKDEEIERNEYTNEDTLDLKEIIKKTREAENRED